MRTRSTQLLVLVDHFLFTAAVLTTGIWYFYQKKIWAGLFLIAFAAVLLMEVPRVFRDYRAGRLGELAINRSRGLFSLICYILWAIVVLAGAVLAVSQKKYLLFIDAALAEVYIAAYLPACIEDYKAYRAENR